MYLRECNHAGGSKEFRSCDPEVLEHLPDCISLEFPAVLTHASAVSRDVLTQLRRDVVGKSSFSHFAKGLHVLGHENYMRRQIGYYDMHTQMQKKQRRGLPPR